MAHGYIQVPPDSTGKRVRHTLRVDLEVTSVLIDLSTAERGDSVVGLTSGATGEFVGFKSELGETFIYVNPLTGTFQAAESITIAGVSAATISSPTSMYTSNVTLVDGNTPANRLAVDNDGSAYMRFEEGAVTFDAFGHAQFSQDQKVLDWIHIYDTHDDEFYNEIRTGGIITGSIINSSIVLSTNTTSGSFASRTSHQYIPYNPGEGNQVIMSYRLGDEGKAGVVRQWGLFDDEDGLFFEMSGSALYVVQRSSASGTVIDTKVPQSSFNGDDLSTANLSHYIIEYSKYNIYWIDYQWLGAGRVRFGTFAPDGSRVVMHSVRNANANTLPYIRKGTLPFRITQFNNGTAASTSESRLLCTAIVRQSNTVDFPGKYYTHTSTLAAVSGSVFVPIMSAKPKVTHKGETNRTTLIPTDFEFFVDGDPIRMDIVMTPNLTGSAFIQSASNDSAYLIDDSATSYLGGSRKESIFAPAGVYHREIVEDLNNTLKLSADGVSQPIYTLAAKTISPTGTANVSILLRWKETH